MLKKMTLALVCCVVQSQPVLADNHQDKEVRCGQYSAFARELMIVRQQDVPVSDVINNLSEKQSQLKDAGENNDAEYQFYIELTRHAYAVPVYRTDVDQQTVVNDFTNKAYLMCMDNQFL